jgi:hypothetical protein
LPLSFTWTQISGPSVVLDLTDPIRPTFTAPAVSGPIDLIFELEVDDGTDKATDQVKITVVNVNGLPVANAGPDQVVNELTPVTLDGSASQDPDGETLSVQWSQVSGPSVVLDLADPIHPTFTAPATSGPIDLVFEIEVDDGTDKATDQVIITVINIGDPPLCDLAKVKPNPLWPPNHKLQKVKITGIKDADDDDENTITIMINSVTSDEQVTGLDSEDLGPDAVIQPGFPSDRLLLRKERDKDGNGRVYEVNFFASNGFGSCAGSLQVTVPIKKKNDPVTDDGQNFDATVP